jgi:cyclophilin family peptidyl-prolyl cis-trans isomerase
MKRLGVLLLVFLPAAPQVISGTLAQFRTVLGNIDVELYDHEKPVTVQNFIRYVRSGAYGNVFFHRCVPNFVVQGGGFAMANPQSQAAFALDAVLHIPTFSPITNEFNSGPHLSNGYGTIAMAKTSDPNSATSQFFFNLTNNTPSLDNTNNSGGFTVFGRVVGGTNVLNFFNTLNKSTFTGVVDFRLCNTNSGSAIFSDLPVLYAGPFCPNNNDLFYTDITLLNVQVRAGDNGAREISWTSVSNRLNTVEFTTNFPPTWQSLTATNGTGDRIVVFDSSPNEPRRFYRVRADY